MLNTMKKRLQEGMEIKKVKEKPSKYEITFLIDGMEIKGELPKTCAPGAQDRIADGTIFNAMCQAAIVNGDIESAKMWLNKITPGLGDIP